MRRALIGHYHTAPRVSLAVCFALHQHLNTAAQLRNFTFLPRNNIGNFIDGADQVADLLLQLGDFIFAHG